MNFPMIVLNVFALFATAGACCCWIFAAIAIHHRKMRSATCVPALAALLAAFRFGMGAEEFSWWCALIGLAVGFVAASMLVSYLYGWVRANAFDEDEVRGGSGRFGPVMYVWTGCILYVGAVLLVNQGVSGTYSPLHIMGF